MLWTVKWGNKIEAWADSIQIEIDIVFKDT